MKESKHTDWVKWEVLLLLWMAYLLNQGDRQVFNTVLPAIRESLGLGDTSVGLIATIFNLFYAFCVPLGGWVGDRYSKKWVITSAILFWSAATMLTGVANSIFMLVIMRSVATGSGEAFFGPANYALLAQYHTDTRARAMSIHQTAYYVGVILAGWLAGYIADRFNCIDPGNGWKYSFIFFGASGILWGIIMILRLKDKASCENNEGRELTNPLSSISTGFKTVFTTPTALALTLGFSGLIFVITGFMTWMPTYLQEELGQSQSAAGFNSMFWTYVAAFGGVLVAGSISDRMASKDHKIRMILQAFGLGLGALPLFVMGGNTNVVVLYTCFAFWGFFRAFFDANTYTILYDVTPQHLHASCSSAMITTGFAVGSFAPVVLGAVKENMGSLQSAFTILGFIWVACGLLMAVTAFKHYKSDFKKTDY